MIYKTKLCSSYVVPNPVLWSGEMKVVAALQQPRQLHQVYINNLKRNKMLAAFVAAFQRGNVGQSTLCMPIPHVPGFPRVCNLTSANGGLPWYCGKPTRGNLSCGDWTKTRSKPAVHWRLTNTESDLMKRYSVHGQSIPGKAEMFVEPP